MGPRLGYNTNGFQSHRLPEALQVIAEIGYRTVGLTLDVAHLDPETATAAQIREIAEHLDRLGLEPVIETGARYALDPWEKHQPTLIHPEPEGRRRRLEYLMRCLEIGADLGAGVLSFWSGRRLDGVSEDEAWSWLAEGVSALCEAAAEHDMVAAFEPEPGMLVAGMTGFARLKSLCPDVLLTLDIGHVKCTEEATIPATIERWLPLVRNVHIEDIRGREHHHLPFGEGDIQFQPVADALKRYDGPLVVELSRDSHRAPVMARESYRFLEDLFGPTA